MNELSEVLDYLDSIDAINYGGCGVSALAVYRWCQTNNTPTSKRPFIFVWSDGYEWECDHNDECLECGNLDSVEVPAHVGIQLDSDVYDSTGKWHSSAGGFTNRQRYQLNESELLHVINNIDGWNSSFRRNKSIPLIEEALGIDLSDVKMEL